MIKLNKFSLKNVVVFKNITLDLTKTQGVTVVYGENKDATRSGTRGFVQVGSKSSVETDGIGSQDDPDSVHGDMGSGSHSGNLITQSNAAGKSLLFASLATLFYGAPPLSNKKNTRKDILTNISNIDVEFEVENDIYRVVQSASNYTIYKNGEDQKVRGIERAKQVIASIFPLRDTDFYTYVYLSTQRPVSFLYESDAKRSEVISSLFRFGVYDLLKDHFSEKLREVKKYAALLEDTLQEKEKTQRMLESCEWNTKNSKSAKFLEGLHQKRNSMRKLLISNTKHESKVSQVIDLLSNVRQACERKELYLAKYEELVHEPSNRAEFLAKIDRPTVLKKLTAERNYREFLSDYRTQSMRYVKKLQKSLTAFEASSEELFDSLFDNLTIETSKFVNKINRLKSTTEGFCTLLQAIFSEGLNKDSQYDSDEYIVETIRAFKNDEKYTTPNNPFAYFESIHNDHDELYECVKNRVSATKNGILVYDEIHQRVTDLLIHLNKKEKYVINQTAALVDDLNKLSLENKDNQPIYEHHDSFSQLQSKGELDRNTVLNHKHAFWFSLSYALYLAACMHGEEGDENQTNDLSYVLDIEELKAENPSMLYTNTLDAFKTFSDLHSTANSFKAFGENIQENLSKLLESYAKASDDSHAYLHDHESLCPTCGSVLSQATVKSLIDTYTKQNNNLQTVVKVYEVLVNILDAAVEIFKAQTSFSSVFYGSLLGESSEFFKTLEQTELALPETGSSQVIRTKNISNFLKGINHCLQTTKDKHHSYKDIREKESETIEVLKRFVNDLTNLPNRPSINSKAVTSFSTLGIDVIENISRTLERLRKSTQAFNSIVDTLKSSSEDCLSVGAKLLHAASNGNIPINYDDTVRTLSSLFWIDEDILHLSESFDDLEDSQLTQVIELLNSYAEYVGKKSSNLSTRIKSIDSNILSLEKAQNTYVLYSTRLEELEVKQQELASKTKDKSIIDSLVAAYSPKGLRNIALSSITTMLQQYINTFSDLLYGENMSFSITATKSGVSAMVTRPNKKVSDIRMLSGSESNCFSLLFMLSVLAMTPSIRRTNFVVLDEMDSHMDRVTKLRFYNNYLPVLKTVVDNVFVITPNKNIHTLYTQDRDEDGNNHQVVDHVLTVKKKNGVSSISLTSPVTC